MFGENYVKLYFMLELLQLLSTFLMLVLVVT